MLPKLNCMQSYQQGILVLLLVIGIIPNDSYGIKCYSCEGKDCNSETQPKECGETMGYCITTGYPGPIIKRDCSSTVKGNCITSKAMRNCYIPLLDQNSTVLEMINKCIEDTKKEGETVDPVTDTRKTETCVCNNDKCNAFAEVIPEPVLGNVKCYQCKGNKSSSCWKLDPIENIKTRMCGGCILLRSDTTVERECVDIATAQCISELSGSEGGCKKYTDKATVVTDGFQVFACINHRKGSERQGEKEQDLNESYITCSCLTDLCNPAERIFTCNTVIFCGILLVFYILIETLI